MKYRLTTGPALRWPDGSVRAEVGEVFEGYDRKGTERQRKAARAWLRAGSGRIVPEPDADVTAEGSPMPEEMQLAMRELEGDSVRDQTTTRSEADHTERIETRIAPEDEAIDETD